MTPKALLSRLNIDPYIAAIVGMVGLASLLPVHGAGAVAGGYATNAAIALLFFLHGARLEPRAALAGARHWRLHVVVLLATFVLFPLLGLTARAVAPALLPPPLWTGLILLCVLPSTVQSSIAFTSIARGNVPAALCAATASNLLGMVLTPLLAGLLLHTHGGFSPAAVGDIVLQLLLPFAAGQLRAPVDRRLGRAQQDAAWPGRPRLDPAGGLCRVQRGRDPGHLAPVGPGALGTLLLVDAALLAAVLGGTTAGEPAARVFPRRTKSSPCSAAPRRAWRAACRWRPCCSPASPVGLIVLPLMLFHQIQLMACAALARRYAARAEPSVRGLPAAVR